MTGVSPEQSAWASFARPVTRSVVVNLDEGSKEKLQSFNSAELWPMSFSVLETTSSKA
jgi:hypothetical protein